MTPSGAKVAEDHVNDNNRLEEMGESGKFRDVGQDMV